MLLLQGAVAAFGAFRWSRTRNRDLFAFPAVPCGDPMAPPKLSRDTPIVDVVHPLQVNGLEIVRRDADLAIANYPFCLVRQAPSAGLRLSVDCHEPLGGKSWLNNGLAAVALADGVGVVFDSRQQTTLLQIPQDHLPRFKAIMPRIWTSVLIHHALIIHDVDLLQVVAQAYLEIVGIMGRRHLHRSGAELRIGK